MFRAALAQPLRSYNGSLRLRLGHAVDYLAVHGRYLRVVPLMAVVNLLLVYLHGGGCLLDLFQNTSSDGLPLDALTLICPHPKMICALLIEGVSLGLHI